MSKHTAGPWVIIPGGDEWSQGRIATIEPKPETMIETNYWTVAEVNNRRHESEANARLIAASPDLIEALEGMISLFPKGVEDDGSGAIGFNESLKSKYRAAVKAISKARSES